MWKPVQFEAEITLTKYDVFDLVARREERWTERMAVAPSGFSSIGAGAEAAMEVQRLRRARRDGARDLAQRLVERVGKLRGDLVAGDRRRRCVAADALGQLQDEVAVANLRRDIDELANQGSCRVPHGR